MKNIKMKLYTLDELEADIKKQVIEKEKENIINFDYSRQDIFEDNIRWELDELFKNNDLKIQYSLGYCQGDGLNIYGDFYLWSQDVFAISERLQNFLINNGIDYITLPKNTSRYNYSVANSYDINDDVYKNTNYTDIDELTEEEAPEEEKEHLKKELIQLEKNIQEYFYKLNKKFEDDGYDFFYNITEEEAAEALDGVMFTAAGEKFNFNYEEVED